MRKSNKVKSNSLVFGIISFVILSIFSIILISMLTWALIASLKARLDFIGNPVGLPNTKKYGIHFENYSIAYQILYVAKDLPNGVTKYAFFLELLSNSILYSVSASALNLFMSMVVAYSCVKFKNKITTAFYIAALIALTMPTVGTMASTLQILRTIKLYDTFGGVIALKSSFATTYFLIFYGIFINVPKDYSEAAKIDGAGNWGIFLRIMVPMVSSTLFACFLLLFIGYWNDYSTQMIYMPNTPVLSYALYLFQNSRSRYATDPVKLCASILVCIPSLTIFLIFRNKIMDNVTLGGLKG